MLQRTSGSDPPPSLQSSGASLPLNFAAPPPLPPAQSFPCNGVMPAHPHPVPPFPPPPHSYSTLHPAPIVSPPPPPPPRSPRHQPFYTLAVTHHPQSTHPPPRPHTVPPLSPFHRAPRPLFPAPPTTTPTNSAETASSIQPRPLPLHPVPLRFPYPTTIGVTCNHCGNHLVVDLSAHHLTNYRPPLPSYPLAPPPPPPPGRPLLWRLPLLRPPPTQTTNSVSTSVPLQGLSGAHIASLCRSPSSSSPLREDSPREGTRPRKTTTTTRAKKGGHSGKGVASNLGIIPYRERKKHATVETYAKQQLELEYLSLERPTVAQMAELAGKLSVPREFVKQWFANRRQEQRNQPSIEGEGLQGTIPSGTHDITIEVPSTQLLPSEDGTENVTIMVSNTSE